MLIYGSLIIQDLTATRRSTRSLKSCVMTKKIDDEYFVSVKNSMFPNIKNYKLTMLQNIYHRFIKEGKLGLEFSEPKQALLIVCDDKRKLYCFYRQVKRIINGKNVVISRHDMPKILPTRHFLMNELTPLAVQYSSVKCFDHRVLNMKNLKKLLLENCDLPTIPIELGELSLQHFSISGSKLPTSKNGQDVFWNWTSINTICNSLTTFKMDSIGVEKLPFEIFFLKNLQSLSARNNKLSYLPQFIGDLKKLECLYVSDNSIKYFPHILSCRTFKQVDISNNLFQLPRSLEFDHIKMYSEMFEPVKMLNQSVKPLSDLAFYNAMDNIKPFKRQDLPRSLWIYFDVVGRCILCNKWILPNYSKISHTFAMPNSISIIKDHQVNGIPWQSLLCLFPNECSGQR